MATVAGLYDAARQELGSDLPQGALRLTRLRLVDTFGTWCTLVGPPDGGRYDAPATVREPAGDSGTLAHVAPPAPPYHALLRPRLVGQARFVCQWEPIAGYLRLDPRTGTIEPLDADNETPLGDNPVLDRFIQWLGQPTDGARLSTSTTLLRVAELRQLASFGAERGLAVVRVKLSLEAVNPDDRPSVAGDLRVRIGDLGSRDDGTLGWFQEDDPTFQLVHGALLDRDVWAEAGWAGEPAESLRGGDDLAITIGTPLKLILVLDPSRFMYVRSGFLPRCRFVVGG